MTTVYKVLRRLTNVKGILSNESGDSQNVLFSLVEHRKVIDGVPGLRSAAGEIHFTGARQAHELWPLDKTLNLAGGGIEARIILVTTERFVVTGPINDVR